MLDPERDSGPEDVATTITSGWSLNGQSWQVGRTSDGTPILNGSTDIPRLTVPAFLFGMGTLVLLPPAFLYFCTTDGLATAFVATVCILLSILCVVTGIRYVVVRNQVLRLVSAAEIARRLNSDSESVQQLASQLELNASYIVNGQPFYKVGDFDKVTVLLRPSCAPIEANLLHPLSGDLSSEVESAERLLHPVSE